MGKWRQMTMWLAWTSISKNPLTIWTWLRWLIYNFSWSRAKERTKPDRIFNSYRNYSEVIGPNGSLIWKSYLLNLSSMISVNIVCSLWRYWKCFALRKKKKVFIVFTAMQESNYYIVRTIKESNYWHYIVRWIQYSG